MEYLTMEDNVCPVCGKQFATVVGREWGWHYKGSKYCSYKCMRHVEIRYRVKNGWYADRYSREVRGLSPAAKHVAAELRVLRHVVRAQHELQAAQTACEDEAMGDTLACLQHSAAQLQKRAAMPYEPLWSKLDENKRAIAYDLFAQGLGVKQVAADRDMDMDLLGVKLCRIYEALGKERAV